MATQAHCAYCFEALSAHYEKRQPIGLARVEELWDRYHATSNDAADTAATDGVGTVEDGEEDAMPGVEETDAPEPGKPAAISRLLDRQGAQGAASAASSNSSLPSTVSASSSAKRQATATPASSNTSLGSRSSLFSFGGRRRAKREEHPLFVTWNTYSARTGNKSLRGCIGTFEPHELEQGLHSYSLTSALEDTRFQPIPASLLPNLSNHVTLLTNFSEPVSDPLDWTLGTHGIRISFTHRGRRYGATYLPDVAVEQGWTKEDTLLSLMRKAGWNGGSGSWAKAWRDGRGELVRYEGKQVGLHYPQWRQWRDWVDEGGITSAPLN